MARARRRARDVAAAVALVVPVIGSESLPDGVPAPFLVDEAEPTLRGDEGLTLPATPSEGEWREPASELEVGTVGTAGLTNGASLASLSSSAFEALTPHVLPGCGCSHYLINNGACDSECYNKECEWDGTDCSRLEHNKSNEQCSEGCNTGFIGDGECDRACNNTLCHFDSGDCLGDNAEVCQSACPSAADRISAGECDADCDGQSIPRACFAHADDCDEKAVQWYRFRCVCVISVIATIGYVVGLLHLIRSYSGGYRGEKAMLMQVVDHADQPPTPVFAESGDMFPSRLSWSLRTATV